MTAVKLPLPQLTTRLQHWKELFSLHRSMRPRNSVAQKEQKEADLQWDLWQTPEEKAVNEINDKLQTQKHWSLEHWHLICKFSLCSGILPPFDVYGQVLTGDAGWGESPFPIISSTFVYATVKYSEKNYLTSASVGGGGGNPHKKEV